jgi:hypothetical protein
MLKTGFLAKAVGKIRTASNSAIKARAPLNRFSAFGCGHWKFIV